MGVLERLRMMTADQRRALRAIDEQERRAAEIEALEEEHLSAEDAYLRRKDRLLGREVQAVYPEIETARSLLRRDGEEQRRRFERMRMAILAGYLEDRGANTTQLQLIPAHGD